MEQVHANLEANKELILEVLFYPVSNSPLNLEVLFWSSFLQPTECLYKINMLNLSFGSAC